MNRLIITLLASILCLSINHAQQTKSGKKLTKQQLDKLFKDVKLPPGDPIPDFVERPWVPPNPDKSKMNKRGTDFGPSLAFTIQLGKKTHVRRGLTVRLPKEHSILYDLDTLGAAATWHGGFIDISKTHYEDSKGRLPGRPGGDHTRWLLDTPGWADADGSVKDTRQDGIGPLPHIKFRGYFLHNFRTILSYSVNGRGVLEMPGVTSVTGDATKKMNYAVTRTFHVSPSEQPLKLALLRGKAGKLFLRGYSGDGIDPIGDSPNKFKLTANDYIILLQRDKDSLQALAVANAPKESEWQIERGVVCFTIPASKKPLSFKVFALTGDRDDLRGLANAARDSAFIVDLRNFVRGGPRRWRKSVVVKGKRGDDNKPYAVDTLEIPSDNPWKSWIRPAAIDFFSDGRLAMSSLNGDVWICRGIDDSLKKLTWQRYATGLYEPLGLKIVNDKLYVLGRDRITRLHDLNLDGEADYYQTFWAGGVTAPGYHAFAFDLQTDSKGNFYFLKSGRKVDDTPGHNAMLKVSADGKKHEIIATGFRHPNGMGIGPNDEIVCGDNQGEFIPCSQINLIRKGKYYGYGKLDPNHERPILCLPQTQDNSCGGQLWAPKDWGPYSGKMLHTSYGSCKMFPVITQFDGKHFVQATAIPFPYVFRSGVMRGRINPADGQVYLSGLSGWGNKAKHDGCLQRIRYTGKPAHLISNVRLFPGVIRIEFTCAIQVKSAEDQNNYNVEQWNYIYSKRYGSPEISVRNPGEKGHDKLEVRRAQISKDRRAVILEVPDLAPVDQLHVHMSLRAQDGQDVETEFFSTIRRLVK